MATCYHGVPKCQLLETWHEGEIQVSAHARFSSPFSWEGCFWVANVVGLVSLHACSTWWAIYCFNSSSLQLFWLAQPFVGETLQRGWEEKRRDVVERERKEDKRGCRRVGEEGREMLERKGMFLTSNIRQGLSVKKKIVTKKSAVGRVMCLDRPQLKIFWKLKF